jgi:uncharacterized protein
MADHLAIVQAIYAAAGVGDWDGVEAHLSDDFMISEAEGLPYAGVWHGKRALRDLYGHVMGFWENPSVEIKEITVGTEHVIGLLQLSGTSKRTGKSFSMPVLEIFRLAGGKVVEIKPVYWDTKHIAEIA